LGMKRKKKKAHVHRKVVKRKKERKKEREKESMHACYRGSYAAARTYVVTYVSPRMFLRYAMAAAEYALYSQLFLLIRVSTHYSQPVSKTASAEPVLAAVLTSTRGDPPLYPAKR